MHQGEIPNAFFCAHSIETASLANGEMCTLAPGNILMTNFQEDELATYGQERA